MRIFGATDIGTKRQTNQDAFAYTVLSQNTVLSVVCDGMGGANAGNIASNMAVATITEYIKRSFVPNIQSSSVKNLLSSAIDTANSDILDKAQTEPQFSGMGTTAVVTLVIGSTAYIAHVGDSRAYLINDDTVEQLTRDHSVVQTLIENGHLTKDEAKNHPERNIITRAIGITQNIECDFTEVSIEKGLLLMCTDGVSNVITEDILINIAQETSLQELPKTIIDMANSLDSGDNVTACVITLD